MAGRWTASSIEQRLISGGESLSVDVPAFFQIPVIWIGRVPREIQILQYKAVIQFVVKVSEYSVVFLCNVPRLVALACQEDLLAQVARASRALMSVCGAVMCVHKLRYPKIEKGCGAGC